MPSLSWADVLVVNQTSSLEGDAPGIFHLSHVDYLLINALTHRLEP